MKKKVLIFGIGGFVGSYLTNEFINNGYEVYGSDIVLDESIKQKVQFVKADLLDSEEIKKIILEIQPSHIINLAAISNVSSSWKIPQQTIAVNVNGTLNILEASRCCNILPRILLIGSSEEYKSSEFPMDETFELNANNPYGVSKVTQEKISEIYRRQYDMKIYYTRAFNHTGIGQKDTFVIPSFCKQVAEIQKKSDTGIIKVGNLSAKRDFSNVKDVVRAYRMIIESEDCSIIYNVGSGIAISLDEILTFIISLSRKIINVEIDQDKFRPIDTPVICCNNSKIIKQLGWKPEIDIFETTKEIYEYYLGNDEENL